MTAAPTQHDRELWLAHRRRQKKLRRMGLADTKLDSEPSAKLINELHEGYGLTLRSIAQATGMTDIHVSRIRLGKSKTILSSNARAIQKLYSQTVTDRKTKRYHRADLVDPRLARLAVQGLMAQGWSRPWIMSKTGVTENTMWRLTTVEGGRVAMGVSVEIQNALVNLAREVGSARGPSNVTRTRALARGWQPTIYVDELV